jgi:5-methyltetrahydrofolate corrinoid/iron sulfur protein methyltransferase
MLIIAERINGTIPFVKDIILNRDTQGLLGLARGQADAGASYIDVNVFTGVGSPEDEIQAMKWAVETIQDELETPLCIDSSDPAVLAAGLKSRSRGKPTMLNSTKAEQKSLEEVIPLAKEYSTHLVALTMDESGIPRSVKDRICVGEKIVEACKRYRLPIEKVFFDLLVMPISTDVKQGLTTLAAVTEIKKEFPGGRTVLGISNISFGLPGRAKLNAGFLHMAAYAGLDAAIVDLLDEEMAAAVKTAELLSGKDDHCLSYLRAFRQ